ncbi:class I SAM-dependent methyltransferase [Lihuaxuella thermophila]|uniref:Methyltransferase domain-containing protein n=1 Tax=Lihuaxuella thermophila TaxID=1173111 RepID=A0A1H8BUJ0_9BACL|nr:class I SAM-dependent methyltransferase [Lihuaxuella thermophila]SEM85794.1 Methyltransferase domain-containing protein [Lihuaxuella thermophila]
MGGTRIDKQISPWFYHWFVRPKRLTKKYIHNHLLSRFQFDGQTVLDFGSGTGANCTIFSPDTYIGVDPDHRRIEYARRIYPKHSFHVLESHRLPVEDKSMDYVLIIAVLHHISTDEIAKYMREFARILKPTGSILVMEPCLDDNKPLCNRFMKWFDKGPYIRNEEEYLNLFKEHRFECKVLNRFVKGLLYNELFFSAQQR